MICFKACSAAIQSDYVPEQCMTFLVDYVSDVRQTTQLKTTAQSDEVAPLYCMSDMDLTAQSDHANVTPHYTALLCYSLSILF